jgi:soluble lytic murein transglycosylase-like protein
MKFFVCLCLAANAFAGEYAVLNTGFRIHAERHETVGSLVRLHTGQGLIEVPASSVVRFEAEDFVATPPAPSVPVVPGLKVSPSPQKLLDSAARKYGLPPEFLRSVAAVESGYRPDAVSAKGAIGIMQLMPATAAKLNADPGNPEQNVDAGARHLRELLLKYDGGVYRALAAYNAGSGAVERYNGIPPYRETQLYVQRVVELYRKLAGKPMD